jgi:hypothetical protein
MLTATLTPLGQQPPREIATQSPSVWHDVSYGAPPPSVTVKCELASPYGTAGAEARAEARAVVPASPA